MTEEAKKPIELKVGDKVWVYENYRRNDPWVEKTIKGENRVALFADSGSWPFRPDKLKTYVRIEKAKLKKGELPGNVKLTRKEIDRGAWLQKSRWEIGDAVRHRATFEQLVKIAEIIAPELLPPAELRES